MTDVSEGSGPIPRRTTRASDGGAPVSGALAIVLAVVAVVAGFLILRSISGDEEQQLGIPSDGGATPSGTPAPADTSVPTGVTAPIPTGAPTSPPIVTQGATVVVANASGVGGTAAQMSTALATVGFGMGDPTNAAGLADALATSIVYYDTAQAGAQAVAESVARSLGGGVTVLPLPAGTPPVDSGNLNGAGVLLMLGTDKAGKTLAELNPTAAPAAPTQLTNPPVGATTVPAG
jgi:LytR cell envelope-related transcriptional attenuator